ncbi:hypothetical protein [Streptomyces africanus]|nr:hypothetical protein [Streptomyces africanus]
MKRNATYSFPAVAGTDPVRFMALLLAEFHVVDMSAVTPTRLPAVS